MSFLVTATLLFATKLSIESVNPGNQGKVCFATTLDAKEWMTLARKQLGPAVIDHPTKEMLDEHYSEMDGGSTFAFQVPAPPGIAAEEVTVLHQAGVRVVHADTLQGTLLVHGKEREAIGVACGSLPDGVTPLFVLRNGQRSEYLGSATLVDSKTFRWNDRRYAVGQTLQAGDLRAVAIVRIGMDLIAALVGAEGSGGCDGIHALIDLTKADLPVIARNTWGCGD
jgi:hypothetical protein